MLPRHGQRLRIFIGQSDRYEGAPPCEWTVRKARASHPAGATNEEARMGDSTEGP